MLFWIITGLCAIFSTIICVSCIVVGARSEQDKRCENTMDKKDNA